MQGYLTEQVGAYSCLGLGSTLVGVFIILNTGSLSSITDVVVLHSALLTVMRHFLNVSALKKQHNPHSKDHLNATSHSRKDHNFSHLELPLVNLLRSKVTLFNSPE
jgi:hypothetical protein